MPVRVQKSEDRFKVVDASGKVHGTHRSMEKAKAQMVAINNSLHKKKTGHGFLPRMIAEKRIKSHAKR